jgi:nucleoside-diphosphate-sugar epimerase
MIRDETELEEELSRPTTAVVETLSSLGGDLVVLGAGGKMGPTLARMARRALDAAGRRCAVTAVARFSNDRVRAMLERAGVRVIACDLLHRAAVERLPDAAAVIFMLGAKFGTTGGEAVTWATNCHGAALSAERYSGVATVVFSTGNVYPLVAVDGGGAVESTPPAPIGEYAQSALARERIFEFFSRRDATPCVIVRLNYAVEPRYGVLLDVAQRVLRGEPIDLRMGYVNCIWQGDANAAALRCLALVRSPPLALNLTGAETISVRWLAERFAERLEREPVFEGEPQPTALLSNASLARRLLGAPSVSLETAIDRVADWLLSGGRTLAKPTRFETRDGRF